VRRTAGPPWPGPPSARAPARTAPVAPPSAGAPPGRRAVVAFAGAVRGPTGLRRTGSRGVHRRRRAASRRDALHRWPGPPRPSPCPRARHPHRLDCLA
jgi:hypothetical protein